MLLSIIALYSRSTEMFFVVINWLCKKSRKERIFCYNFT
ncbi:hypothetical protein N499_1027 [Wolbachia pipientis wVitA]|nr:hypothetical protein N499_1027 [Wolbachia pipientis wVitA]